jgi:hypothetical protein
MLVVAVQQRLYISSVQTTPHLRGGVRNYFFSRLLLIRARRAVRKLL